VKGQYIAVESMLSFAVGLVVAFGIIAIFGGFRGEVVDTAKDNEIEIVQSRIANTVYQLESLPENSTGSRQIDLPERIGGQNYQVLMGRELDVVVEGENYTDSMTQLSERYTLEGQVEGGTVTIYKRGNQFLLRPGQ
jgi:hypothetical protein